ncbi:thiamine pyrophosphokinase [Streptococcus gallinaceus]|uniref:thiamine diphosphokinase n=1 Tax=Streptococcus gallinaceus TaxID=165758 RepID=UPI0020A06A1E|nr:thiamine diphosphokinase [Streptococcus gallinaceus]MCP1639597.1 thiamine pyrophosphokinase [Streptococcus gallinaceus]MCP1770380.1 thiamine pyrophosphokinase [Streptococcus gallinaceus]
MIKVAVVAGGDLDLVMTGFDVFVGVDAGSLFLLKHNLPLDMAVGDFDSVSAEELQWIKAEAKSLTQAPAEKDDTDLELALKTVFEQYPEAQVSVLGAFGGRLDHMMSNLFLASEPSLASFMQQIKLQDSLNLVRFFPQGRHLIEPVKGMTYVSFMPSDGSRLTIEGAKYPLNTSNYFFKKCYSSNEFIDEDLVIELDSGYVVVIYSKDRS